MNEFHRAAQQLARINLNKIMFTVWETFAVQQFITQLNTKNQLFDKGEDSLGVSLGEYSPFTQQIKVSKGQRVDHITLNDTGEFYESFMVTPFRNGFLITADPVKDDDNLFVEYGEEIVGLNDENKRKLIQFIQPFIAIETEKALSSIR